MYPSQLPAAQRCAQRHLRRLRSGAFSGGAIHPSRSGGELHLRRGTEPAHLPGYRHGSGVHRPGAGMSHHRRCLRGRRQRRCSRRVHRWLFAQVHRQRPPAAGEHGGQHPGCPSFAPGSRRPDVHHGGTQGRWQREHDHAEDAQTYHAPGRGRKRHHPSSRGSRLQPLSSGGGGHRHWRQLGTMCLAG